MADESAGRTRKEAWSPPPRPDWVRRVNEEGRWLDAAGVVPLDPASLVATAMRNTGLSDFGDDDWREPFEKFLAALDSEAELNLIGRIMTRSDILMLLEARLRIEDLYRRHPEIEEVELVKPIWIAGQGRTGTSYLQMLLGLDPHHRELETWRAMFPVPWNAPGEPDTRIALADERQKQWLRVTPETNRIHEFSATVPMETILVETIGFQCPAWLNLLGLVPSYNAYMARIGPLPALRYGRRVLKLLEWLEPGRRWVLKSPDSMQYLPEVLEVFPDACLIWPHRDPIKALSSAVNMIGTLSYIRSDRTMPEGVFATITDSAATAANLSRAIDWIEQGRLPADQICHVLYHRLMEDPFGELETVYRHFDLPFGDALRARVEAFLRERPRSARPAHAYDTGGDQRVSAEREAFRRYQAYFGIPSEM